VEPNSQPKLILKTEATRHRPRRARNTVILGVVVAGGLWFAYDHYVHQPTAYEGPGLKFSVGPCEESMGIPPPPSPDGKQSKWSPPKEGVKSVRWADEGTLRIVALMIANCAARVSNGGYSVHTGTIYLAYKAKVEHIPAACNCAYRLAYDISSLPRADYGIYFPTTGMSVP
jgi:hypothetical protein